jgi:hypothetical protein
LPREFTAIFRREQPGRTSRKAMAMGVRRCVFIDLDADSNTRE